MMSDVKVGVVRESLNRTIAWRNGTDLGLHKRLDGESTSVFMWQKLETRF